MGRRTKLISKGGLTTIGLQFWVVVKFTTVFQTSGPCEDGGDGIGGGRVTLLVFPIMYCDSSVGTLSLNGFAIGADKDRCHETQGSVTCEYKVITLN